MKHVVQLPEAVFAALEAAARASGTTTVEWIAAHLPPTTQTNGPKVAATEDWLDRDFLRTYAQEADDTISLEAVRAAMAKIPGRLADDIRAERDER